MKATEKAVGAALVVWAVGMLVSLGVLLGVVWLVVKVIKAAL